MKKLLLFILILFLPFIVSAKEMNIDFQKNFGGSSDDFFEKIVVRENGNILAVGYYYSKDIEGVRNNGSLDAMIMEFNQNGEIIWKNTFGSSSYERLYSLDNSLDDGYVIVGDSSSSSIIGSNYKGGYDALIVKYDKDNKFMWQKVWGGSDDDSFKDVISTKDGGYIVIGSYDSDDISDFGKSLWTDAVIVKYDKEGNLLWENNFSGNGHDIFNKVIEVSDGYIVVGYSSSSNLSFDLNNYGSDGIIAKYDFDGDLLWVKNWGYGTDDELFSIKEVSDGYIIVGNTYGENYGNGKDAIIIKLGKNGNLLWENKWGGSSFDTFESVGITNDECLIAVGYFESDDISGIFNQGGDDLIIVVYDKDGNFLYHQSFGGSSSDSFFSIVVLENDTFAVAGYSSSGNIDGLTNFGGGDGTIIKFSMKYVFSLKEEINGVSSITNDSNVYLIKPVPDFGYEVDEVIAKNTKDENVDVIKNDDGTFTIVLNDDINVEVLYRKKYLIEKKDSVNGKIEVVRKNNLGIIIPVSDKGYVVEKVLVKNSKNEYLDVARLYDGNYSFELNDDVSVEVVFKKELVNPKTGVVDVFGILVIGFVISFIGFILVKKNCSGCEI